MQLVTAPDAIGSNLDRPWLFLAGSIEGGDAEHWQDMISTEMRSERGTILNPRRDDWDNSWEQRASFEPFRKQVAWEQMAIRVADFVFFYFSDGTRSPITLLELGQCVEHRPGTTIVRCTPGFWRLGNVEMVCEQASVPIPVYEDTKEALETLRYRLIAQYASISVESSPMFRAEHPSDLEC